MSEQAVNFIVEHYDNDELAETNEMLALLVARYTRENDQLKNENAMLRELVREMWEGYNDPPCEGCPLKDKPACVDCPICAREAAVIGRMRDLGIDVGE